MEEKEKKDPSRRQRALLKILDLTSIDENIFSKSLAKAFKSTSLFVAPISTNADAIDSYSLVDIDAKKTSIAAHVLGDMRPTIPGIKIELNIRKIPSCMSTE